MKLKILSIVFLAALQSCTTPKNSPEEKKMDFRSTSMGTLKGYYQFILDGTAVYASEYFLEKHKDEVLKTLEIVEEVEIEKDVFLVFYKYSIGADIAKETMYMKKIDGLFIPHSTYYSSYDDDPFKNGKPEEAKQLLKKKDNWEENSIWWAK